MGDQSKTKQWKVRPIKYRKKCGKKVPYQGYFYPGHPDKYEGNVDNIVFRSGMELRFFQYLDDEPSVLTWSSEETVIPYISPKDGRTHRYFVDAKVVSKTAAGIQTYLVEIKPSYQCVPPNKPKKPNKRNTARFLREMKTYEINEAKWQAAEAFCAKKGWKFIKITEKQLVY